MVFTFTETPEWGSETANPPSFTAVYRAVGEQNSYLVQQQALALTAPAILRPYGTLYRQDIQTEPDGWANYIVTVPYAPRSKEYGSVSFSFSTSGATINIKAGREHVASWSAGNTGDPDTEDWHKGAIGVREDGDVEGTEIIIPALKLTYELKHPQGIVTEAYAKLMSDITGTTNSATFRTFSPGELLFIGADGADGTDADASVRYDFIASANASGFAVGPIGNIIKKGHDNLWIEFEDEVESGEPVRRPKRVHIDRVYDAVNFASYLGWS